MKTMEDFKGTKGNFEVNGNKIQVNPNNPMETSTVCMLFGSPSLPEAQANAKLFANSKNVLQAAIEARTELAKCLRYEAAKAASSFAQINDYVAEHPIYSKLDEVINASL